VRKNKVRNVLFQLAILVKVSPFVSSFVMFGSWEFWIDPPGLPEDLEETLRFSGPPFDLLSLDYLNAKIAGGCKIFKFLQVVLLLLGSQSPSLDASQWLHLSLAIRATTAG
jgi:hypothetical protein